MTKPNTATAFPLQLRLHHNAARVGGPSFQEAYHHGEK